MLWQHGLEGTGTRRTAIAAAFAFLLAAAILAGVPTETPQAREIIPGAANSESATPAAQVPAPATQADALQEVAPTAAPRRPTPTPANPALNPLPKWVQSIKEIVLWSTSGATATQLSTLPEGSYLQVLGQPESGRLPVYVDGNNTGGRGSRAWVNPADVRASDPPARVVASSRGGSRSTEPDISTRGKFISVVAEAAQGSQRATEVPSSVTVAQAILESDWGDSLLATKAFNFFGIKAQRGPGPAGVVNMDTREVFNGASVVVNAAFKAYHNIFESVDDHGRFLRDNPRYSAAFPVANDATEFARRINAAGYATDPAYSSKLIHLMDKYDLYRYDLPTP